MKLYFLDGGDQWSSIATMLGYEVGVGNVVEDIPTNVVFIPEYIPVSHVKCRHARVVVVWRNYSLGVIENIDNSINIVTDTSLIEKVKNATFIPEGVHDIFSILSAVSDPNERTQIIESDDELQNKTLFERAHIFKKTKSYKGKKFLKEAYASGCDIVISSETPFYVDTKEHVAKSLNEFLSKLKIFLSIQEKNK